jgi:hypothetical protein
MQNDTAARPALPWVMLVARSALFFIFQCIFAAFFWLTGTPDAWTESAHWWIFQPIFANIVTVALLVYAFRAEGKRYIDILRFSKDSVGKDLLLLLGTSAIGLPIASAPMSSLATLLFGDAMIPVRMLFRPLPTWALVVGILFPLTIAFSELPTYFGYVMPRLEAQLKNGWVAWLIASFFLAAQHSFLPLIIDGRFMLWRFGMYLPFGLFAGLILKLRPQLLPYFVIIHALMDISALSVYLMPGL